MEKKVLAVVAGEEITHSEFDWFTKTIPADKRERLLENPQFKQQCLQQIVALHLFAKLGEELELEKTEEYASVLKNTKKDILAELAMTQTMNSLEPASEEDLKKYYDENKEKFNKGAQVTAKHILTKEEDKSKEILEKLNNGEMSFEEAAQTYSTCPSGQRGGNLGEFGKGQMVKEFEDAAFSAEIGKVVGPVKTQFGYHLIMVDSRTEEQPVAFEEVKETIKGNLFRQAQDKLYNDTLNGLSEKYGMEMHPELL